MKRVLAFSKNLAYGVGGAEISLKHELVNSGARVKILYSKSPKAFSANKYRINFPRGWELVGVEPEVAFSRFFYNEYAINRKRIKESIVEHQQGMDQLWVQNLWAPAAIIASNIETVYFARDESFFCCRSNYFSGLKKQLKRVYEVFDTVGFRVYSHDQQLAVRKATTIVANSNYMAERIFLEYGRTAEVRYPFVDKEGLAKDYLIRKDDVSFDEKGVVLVGDSFVKGVHIFHKLAMRFKDVKFYVFCRGGNHPVVKGNVTYMPWQKNSADIYKLSLIHI